MSSPLPYVTISASVLTGFFFLLFVHHDVIEGAVFVLFGVITCLSHVQQLRVQSANMTTRPLLAIISQPGGFYSA